MMAGGGIVIRWVKVDVTETTSRLISAWVKNTSFCVSKYIEVIKSKVELESFDLEQG